MLRLLTLGVCAMALGGAAPPQAAAPAPLAIEAFAEIPQIQDPQISPNGKRIAGKIAIRGTQLFAVISPGSGEPPKLINPGKSDLNGWYWVNDEWLVISTGQQVPVDGFSWYVTRSFGYSVDSGKVTRLARDAAQNGGNVIWRARDGSARVLLSFQTSPIFEDVGFWPQVDEVDLATGKRRNVVRSTPGVFNWYADGDGVVRMGIGTADEGRSRRLLYRDSADAAFRTIDRVAKREQRLIVPTLFLRDSGKALVIDDDEGGFSALYELDLATLERGKQLFASKGYDIEGIVTDPTGFGYLGVAVNENRPHIRWTDPAMVAMQAAVSDLV